MSTEVLPWSNCGSSPAEVTASELNAEFESLTPRERIGRAAELYGGRLITASSFGPTAPVLLGQVVEVAPNTPVVTVRHYHETDRTLELIDWYEQELGLDLRVYEAPRLEIPEEDTTAFADFQRQIKVEPFQAALNELRPCAYFSGVMRWQSTERTEQPIVEDKGGVIAIYPVVDLSPEAVANFFAETGLPMNDDYFDPAKGRSQKLECGLNTTNYELSKEEE